MKRLLFVLLFVPFVLQAQFVTAYYAAWTKWNAVPVSETDLDYSCATHWIMFTRGPQANGTFDQAGSGIDAARDLAFVQGAHAAGKKALIGTGGWGSDYTGVVNNISVSVPALVKLMDDYGYDGIDLDWEPVPAGQATAFHNFIVALKTAKPNMILTAACFNFDPVVVQNQQYFDQINLMTYDMSGAWNPVSWHNSPLYSPGGNLGSITSSLKAYTDAGVPKSKLGFGIELYAYVWNGVTGPQQSPFGTITNTVPYWNVMQNYYDKGAVFKYDAVGGAYYFATPSQFVSMDFEESMPLKAKYARDNGIGGVIIYEAGVGRVPGQVPEDRIMQKVKEAFLGGPVVPPLPYIAPPPPPVKHSYTVYDNQINTGWWSTSWVQGGLNFSAIDPTNANNPVISVGYNAWDGLRFHTGSTWGNQVMVGSDTLVFDIYPQGSSFTPTILIENGIARVLSAPANKWTRMKVACPPSAFSWFYIQNNTGNLSTVYFDNIHFTVGTDTVPPPVNPPPVVSGPCDTVGAYDRGYVAGRASVIPVVVHDTVRVNVPVPYAVHDTTRINVPVYPPQIGYQYIHSQIFPDTSVALPTGFIVTSTVYTATTKKVTIRGLKPKY